MMLSIAENCKFGCKTQKQLGTLLALHIAKENRSKRCYILFIFPLGGDSKDCCLSKEKDDDWLFFLTVDL